MPSSQEALKQVQVAAKALNTWLNAFPDQQPPDALLDWLIEARDAYREAQDAEALRAVGVDTAEIDCGG